ncbi:MAG: hypothetical protein KKF48_05590 [Nanoarchaeota archaeon]|nr:hypothetical protein [Nanoarchaeota archaeon]MBU1028490.1 hypothetical protein [Nanoarchaeota archaeon]
MKLIIKKGKSLPDKQIKKWNKTRIEDWGENKPLSIKNRKKYANDIFFILYNKDNEVLSSGRIRLIKIKFLGKSYEIFGSADLISEIKGKGYGKKVKRAQIKYGKQKKKTMIGFCSNKNVPFYKKCGLKVERRLAKRFVYPDPRAYKDTDPNCIYINGKDNLMKQILAHPKEKVKIPISRW